MPGQKSDMKRNMQLHLTRRASLWAGEEGKSGAADSFSMWQVSKMAGVCRTFRRRACPPQ